MSKILNFFRIFCFDMFFLSSLKLEWNKYFCPDPHWIFLFTPKKRSRNYCPEMVRIWLHFSCKCKVIYSSTLKNAQDVFFTVNSLSKQKIREKSSIDSIQLPFNCPVLHSFSNMQPWAYKELLWLLRSQASAHKSLSASTIQQIIERRDWRQHFNLGSSDRLWYCCILVSARLPMKPLICWANNI